MSQKTKEIEKYLKEKGIVGEIFSVSELEGGIHNDVFLVKSDKDDFVYKKHLQISKTHPDIALPPHRYENERNSYHMLKAIMDRPINPKLYLADDKSDILILEYIASENRVDKIIKSIEPKFFANLGKILAQISNKTYNSEEILKTFSHKEFQELKYEYRYYKFITNEKLFFVRDWLMEETRKYQLAFMHGDPRLNNIFFKDNNFYFIDYEGAYYADLPLDIAYLLSEILIFYYNDKTEHFKAVVKNIWEGYMAELKVASDFRALENKIVKHIGFALLDKIFGIIKDDYSFVRDRNKFIAICEEIIANEKIRDVGGLLKILLT